MGLVLDTPFERGAWRLKVKTACVFFCSLLVIALVTVAGGCAPSDGGQVTARMRDVENVSSRPQTAEKVDATRPWPKPPIERNGAGLLFGFKRAEE
jgi:hypothetical protein